MPLKTTKKPVWAEGVLLAQQHFQMLEQYQEQQLITRHSLVSAYASGISELRVDTSALQRGVLQINVISAVFDNGRYVEYSNRPDRELKLDLDLSRDEITVYLAIAANRVVADIDGYDKTGQLSAFTSEYIEVSDEHDQSRVRELLVADPHLILLTDNDVLTYFDSIKCIKVIKSLEGTFSIDDNYIPPLIHVGASTYLVNLLNRTANLLNAKVRVLLGRRRSFGAVSDFGPNEMNSFLLLNAMAPSASIFEHLKTLPVLHPEKLYCHFAELISKVAVFEHSDLVTSVPKYEHQNLTNVFATIDELLGKLLEGVVPKKMAALNFERVSNAIYQIPTIDLNVLQNNDFYLAVFLESENTQWIEIFSEQVKVGASEKLEIMIASALNGVAITHCQRPPNKLAIKSGYEYFRLETFGVSWQQILEEQSLSLFVPHNLQTAKIEIVTVNV